MALVWYSYQVPSYLGAFSSYERHTSRVRWFFHSYMRYEASIYSTMMVRRCGRWRRHEKRKRVGRLNREMEVKKEEMWSNVEEEEDRG